jgi:hypothetical protein
METNEAMNGTGKPLLALDIDDVLNHQYLKPFSVHRVSVETKDLAHTPFTNEWEEDVIELPVRIARVYLEWLAELSEEFEIVWASTWEKAANRYISPLVGLGELGVVEFSANQPTPTEIRRDDVAGWKLRSIVEYANGRPFAFVDDRAYSPRIAEIAAALDPPALVVAPVYGLRRSHVDELLRYARGEAPAETISSE